MYLIQLKSRNSVMSTFDHESQRGDSFILRIRYKTAERDEIASNLVEAENAINTFYQCLENKNEENGGKKD